MINILIDRWYQEDCTIGRLTAGSFQCFTLELPWLSNRKNISCIPDGQYNFKPRHSPKNGSVLQLEGVENRTFIQVHSGNYTSQIQGCILVGDSIRFLNSDSIPDVTNSKNTLAHLLQIANGFDYIEIR